MATSRRLVSWLGDTVCGLVAYTLSRWIWQRNAGGVFENLLPELGTFATFFVLLKLALKGLGLARRKPQA